MDGLILPQQKQLMLLVMEVNATNKAFNFFIQLSNGGSFQLKIGSVCNPQLCLNAGTNRCAILQELQRS